MNDTEYRRIFDGIAPDADLVARTKRAMAQKQTRPAGRRWLRRTVLACAAACVLTIGALAAAAAGRQVNPADMDLTVWQPAENAVPVGVSASSLGWTITVEEVCGGQWYAELLCTLSRDDGKVLTQGEYGFSDWRFDLDEENWSAGIQWFYDEDQGDNKIQFGFSIANDHQWDLTGRTLRLELGGLMSANYDESLELLLRGGGSWTVDVPLSYTPAGMTDYAPMLPLTIDGRTGVLETLHFSPTAVWGEGSSTEGAFTVFNGTLADYDPADGAAWLVLTDGTRIKGGAGGGRGDGSRITVEFYPDGPIRPEEVCGIVIAQTEYPLALK